MPVRPLAAASFKNSFVIDWWQANGGVASAANFQPGAYVNQASGRAVTVQQAVAGQAVAINITGDHLRCNLPRNTGLLLANNNTNAPVQLRLQVPVPVVGAYVVCPPPAPFGTPYTGLMWVWLVGAQRWESVAAQGATGDLWIPGTAPPPFLGAQADPGDAFGAVYFDAVHPSQSEFNPIGIGPLYFHT